MEVPTTTRWSVWTSIAFDYGLDLAAGDNSILFTIDGSTGC